MIAEMPRPRPKWLQKHTTRHGRTVWYVRVKRGPLIRIHAEFGTPEFDAEYQAAIAGAPPPKKQVSSESLQWLYDRYRESLKWTSLSGATRRQRENILAHVMVKAGHEPFKAIDSSDVEGGLDDRRNTPAQARNFLDAMTGLFRWARKNNHITTDPTAGVERPKRLRGSKGHAVWEEADVAAYRKAWPIGTRQRVWFEVLFGTGLRRGDAAIAGWQHISKEGVLSLATEKTGMVMHCVIEADMMEAITACPKANMRFVVGENGGPLTKETFGNFFRVACLKAGVDKSAHGIRKLAATMDAERGWTERELEAKYGWTGGFMASLYTRSANRKRMAVDAARRSMLLPEMRESYRDKSGSDDNELSRNEISLVRSRRLP